MTTSPFANMSFLGKLGATLQNTADPGYVDRLRQQSANRALQQQELGLGQQRIDLAEQQIEAERQAREQRQAQIAAQAKALGRLSTAAAQGRGVLPPQAVQSYLQQGGSPEVLGQLQKAFKPKQQEMVRVYDPAVGGMVFAPKEQALGRLASEPKQQERRIVQQNGVQYYVDTGQPVIPTANMPEISKPAVPLTLPQGIADPSAKFRDVDKAQIKLYEKGAATAEKYREGLDDEKSAANRLRRFLQLQEVQDTGPHQVETPLVGYRDPELREMKAIQSEIAPRMRAVGSGASSDRDIEMFKEATVDPKKPRETNINVANARIAAAENKIDRAAFFQEFLDSYGHTSGADAAWKEYLENNPIFSRDATAKDYKSMFGGQIYYYTNITKPL